MIFFYQFLVDVKIETTKLKIEDHKNVSKKGIKFCNGN